MQGYLVCLVLLESMEGDKFMQCCQQIPQVVPILLNPITWMAILAAISLVGKKKK